MRIIDADILKKEVKTMFCPDGYKIMMLERIDKAPSVDIKDEIAGAYNEGYMCGNKEAEKGRPQGEWTELWFNSTDGRHNTGWFVCNKCGKEPPNETNIKTNFCPNCGADMRGAE